jgi:hypothetical protein
MITAKEQFSIAINKALGQPGLSKERRMREVVEARRCRNVFFNAIAPVAFSLPFPSSVKVQAVTRSFGHPIIVTDMLNYTEALITGNWFSGINFELQIYLSGLGNKEDFFGCASSPLPSFLTLGHEQNAQPVLGFNGLDGPSNKINFMPYILRTGEVFEINWNIVGPLGDPPATQLNCEADFRGVVVLPENDPYACLKGRVLDSVCAYIDRHEPETFLLDIRIPQADFPTAGNTRAYPAELQDRPLLIMGIGSNIDGAQVRFRDVAAQWEFTFAPIMPQLAFNGATGQFVNGLYPKVAGIPLYVVAPDTRLTARDAYYMLPVPHFVEPNGLLEFQLTNGLRPRGTAPTYQQAMAVNGFIGADVDLQGGDGHITLLCRTV